jgi:hypothetical protein
MASSKKNMIKSSEAVEAIPCIGMPGWNMSCMNMNRRLPIVYLRRGDQQSIGALYGETGYKKQTTKENIKIKN